MVISCLTLALSFAQPSVRPELVTARRPTYEVSTWVSLGGGALAAERTRAVFDARVGADVTTATCEEHPDGCTGDARVGPFVEAGSASFSSVTAVGGLELFWGAVPRALRMFYYTGEGTLAVRLGGGWTWRRQLPGNDSTPVASVTVTYGYRAPFTLQEYASQVVDVQTRRQKARYMIGARLYLNAQVDIVQPAAWQATAGIEFEPVGAFRYLTGLGY